MNDLTIAIIIGSIRSGRFGPTGASWIAGRARARPELAIDIIDLVETPLPTVFPHLGQAMPEREAALVGAVAPRLAAADAFIVVTPEYNRSFPASLKNAIDWHKSEWSAKPVGFVSYGGVSGGLRAVEQLRLVFAELHAVTVRSTVSFANMWDKFDEAGQPRDSSADKAAEVLLDELAWWARALREAKVKHPYVA